MTIDFRCECGRPYRVGAELAGKKAQCKSCGRTMRIPVPHSREPRRLRGLRDWRSRLMALETRRLPGSRYAAAGPPERGFSPCRGSSGASDDLARDPRAGQPGNARSGSIGDGSCWSDRSPSLNSTRRTPCAVSSESLVPSLARGSTRLPDEPDPPGVGGQPVEDPPPIAVPDGPLPLAGGTAGGLPHADPGDGRKHPAIVWITGGDTATPSTEDVWAAGRPEQRPDRQRLPRRPAS